MENEERSDSTDEEKYDERLASGCIQHWINIASEKGQKREGSGDKLTVHF